MSLLVFNGIYMTLSTNFILFLHFSILTVHSTVFCCKANCPHSWLITGFVTIVTWGVPHVEQELLTLQEHMRSSLVFSGVRVAWSLVFCVMFCRSLFVVSPFSFGHCVVYSSIYSFWLPFVIFKLFLNRDPHSIVSILM